MVAMALVMRLALSYFLALANVALFHASPATAIGISLNWLRYSRLPNIDHSSSADPQTQPVATVFEKLNNVISLGGPCDTCKMSLKVIREATRAEHGAVAAVLYGICSGKAIPGGIFSSLCEHLHLYSMPKATEGFSFLPDFANALAEVDSDGLDGEYLCHYMFSNACPRPETPIINYENYWPPKPSQPRKMTRSGETFRVMHVSDVHLSANYTEGAAANCLSAMCCDNVAIQDPFDVALSAPKFGHWRCDAPPALLESAMVDTSRSDYRFALFTGDMVDHNPAFISKHDTLLEEEWTLRSLKKHLGDIPVFPVLGNHDSYPYSQEPAPTSRHAERTAYNIELMRHMWSEFGWVRGKDSRKVNQTHGGYSVEVVPGLKVITLNSNYWYRWNFYNYIGMTDPDPSGMLGFLIDELVDCEERGISAWVQAHVSPGGLSDEALPPAATFFAAILERFSETITGQFFGHTHLDEFSILYANNATKRIEDNALNVAWVAPSITPYTDLNPAWRYYEVDTATFEIMDSVTIAADIEPTFGQSWDEAPNLNWGQLYSAREMYGPATAWPADEPLTGKFWHRIAKELLYNQEFALEFVRRSYRESSRAPDCDDHACRAERYCYATSMTPDQVEQCHQDYNAGKRLKPSKHLKKNAFGGFPTFPMPRPIRHGKLL